MLCGSKKYPVKDPFAKMMNQSLSTFMNAFTADDYTMYPVGSKNNKDFKNLVSVYLDAVFEPNMLKNSNILKQEGWHYELDLPKGELKTNGTVYNEMSGYETSASDIMFQNIKKSLLPNTNYKWNYFL